MDTALTALEARVAKLEKESKKLSCLAEGGPSFVERHETAFRLADITGMPASACLRALRAQCWDFESSVSELGGRMDTVQILRRLIKRTGGDLRTCSEALRNAEGSYRGAVAILTAPGGA